MFRIKTFTPGLNGETYLFFTLLGLTLISSAINVTFVYGISFTYTSIFIFLMFRLFSLPLAIVASLLTFLFIPYDDIFIANNLISLLEILFVGVYFYIKKRAKMFFVDAFFWFTIGLAAIFFANKPSFTGDALYFQILIDILNGLFNVLIADMLLAYFPFYKLVKSRPLSRNHVSIHQFLTHITVISVLIPFFLIILTKTWNPHELISEELLFKEFLIHLRLSVVFSLFTITFVHLVNRLFMNNLKQLTIITTDLPQKLIKLEKVEWPQSNISDLRLLSENLKEMTQKLKELFQESIEMNKILTDQTQKLKESEDKLHQLAYYDVLTSLPNRLHFQKYVTNLIYHHYSKYITIIFLDLNQFKQINDTLGHDAGDTLLQLTANKLKTIHDDTKKVFRLGGDEFVIVQNCDHREEITSTLNQIQNEFSSPFCLNEQLLYITASIGISLYPDDGNNLDTLVKCADIAMYVSKEKGGNAAQFFDETMRGKFKERLLLENSLRSVVKKGGFQLFYQPKIQNDEVTSIETLLRWSDPYLGNIPPSTFIPVAEEIGLISKIDEWALLEACRQNKIWQDENILKVPVSVNISAKNFQHDHLYSMIENALCKSGMSPNYLKLEITESVFIKNPQRVTEVINRLKSLGVLISIDDFGKGYSSFIRLLQLPIDEIKIDSQFIKDIDQHRKKTLLVKSIIDIAHGLHLNVVAEGVETPHERNILIQMGCDELQGYLFSPPISNIEMEKFLNENKKQLTS